MRTEAVELIDAAQEADQVFVSPISAWEVALLVARGRLALPSHPIRWFEAALAKPGIFLAALTPSILVASTALDGLPTNDPADRIIAATARELGHRVVTRDSRLLAYAATGNIRAMAC